MISTAQWGKWATYRPNALCFWQLLIKMCWVLFLSLLKDVLPNLTRKATGLRRPCLSQQSPPHLLYRCWWSGRILMRMSIWDREAETQRSALLYILKPSILISSPRFKKISFVMCSQQLRAKLRTCPEGWAALWPPRSPCHLCAQMSSLRSTEPGQLPGHLQTQLYGHDIWNGHPKWSIWWLAGCPCNLSSKLDTFERWHY